MFKLHCDRCNAYMKQVGGPEAKTMSLDGVPVICKKCQGKEDKFNNLADKLKRQWDSKINEMVAEAKEEIIKGLKKV